MAENIEVKLPNVRLSFFHGFKPQERRDDKTKELTGYNYNTAILLDKKTQADLITKIKEAMKAARESEWGDTPPRIPAERLCLRDGEPIDPDTVDPDVAGSGTKVALYDGYAGQMVLAANRVISIEDYEAIKKGQKDRPVTIIGPRKGANGKFAILAENSEFAPYSGCYANVIVRIYPLNKGDYPARINASLEAVQFAKHGERFGGAGPIDADSAFDEVEGFDDMDTGGDAGAKKAALVDDDMLA